MGSVLKRVLKRGSVLFLAHHELRTRRLLEGQWKIC
jgi:hypothetical protein